MMRQRYERIEVRDFFMMWWSYYVSFVEIQNLLIDGRGCTKED
jgi:hypothetical protein